MDDSIFTGKMGPRGPTGPAGKEGPPGKSVKGDRGPQGERGYRGYTGPQGKRGHVGEKGDTGPTGYTGYTGHTGPRGDPGGITGYTGPEGRMGMTGQTGPTGPQGPQGHKGDGIIWSFYHVKMKTVKLQDTDWKDISEIGWLVEVMRTVRDKCKLEYKCNNKKFTFRISYENYDVIELILTHISSNPNIAPLQLVSDNGKVKYTGNIVPGNVFDVWVSLTEKSLQ